MTKLCEIGVVQDVFSKFHTVLIYGKKNTELAGFREIVFKIYSIQFKKAFLRGLFLMVTEMLGNATSMLGTNSRTNTFTVQS